MIRGSLKGHYLDYPGISEEFNYWFFARAFGYTPDQVDALPYDRMIYMREFEVKKGEKGLI